MKTYNENKDSLYLKYLDKMNLYWWAMFQKLQVGTFEWVKSAYFTENEKLINEN